MTIIGDYKTRITSNRAICKLIIVRILFNQIPSEKNLKFLDISKVEQRFYDMSGNDLCCLFSNDLFIFQENDIGNEQCILVIQQGIKNLPIL